MVHVGITLYHNLSKVYLVGPYTVIRAKADPLNLRAITMIDPDTDWMVRNQGNTKQEDHYNSRNLKFSTLTAAPTHGRFCKYDYK
jgi:hypothetical protein